MSTGSIAATAGASAAAAAAAAARQEEEEMTDYSPQDLAEGWEFKIIRSATGAFKRQETLREVLAQEAKAGWILVEKFDDGRVRLKRPAAARENDRMLEFDPYRTTIGRSPGAQAALIIGVLVAFAIGLAVAAQLVF